MKSPEHEQKRRKRRRDEKAISKTSKSTGDVQFRKDKLTVV